MSHEMKQSRDKKKENRNRPDLFGSHSAGINEEIYF